MLSIQPLSAAAGIVAAEYEHVASPRVTFGLGGTFSSQTGSDWFGEGASKVTYLSGDVKLRYYPAGRALAGFAVGVLAGFVDAHETRTDYFGGGAVNSTSNGSSPSIGVSLDYGWLVGAKRSLYLAIGAGAKRIFIDENKVPDVLNTYPTARISIGYAF